jgi:hypothetical protein
VNHNFNSTALNIMKFEDLKLTYGYPLQLQANTSGQPERFSCRLIGCLPGRSILLSVPRVAGKYVRFRPGQKLVARLMVGNGVGLFACTVETLTSEPYPILFVTYPDSVSFKGIRGATRVGVEVAVDVDNLTSANEQSVSGIISDISSSGARMEMARAVGSIGDTICVRGSIEVLGIARDLRIEAVIRSRVELGAQEVDENLPAIYGIEFVEKDEDRRLLLYAYVFSQIAQDDQAQ